MSSTCGRRIGIVSADLHNRFVTGNSEGRITATTAVVSAFLASHGILRYGSVTADMRRRTAAALEAVGVGHLSRRTLDQMSSGEARRVMLARALVTSPDALVLDEPTTGLDLVARHDFMERVRGIARAGTTLILITHHIEEIIPEITRVVLLRGGRIVLQDGPKSQVLTAAGLTELFGLPVVIDQAGGYLYARRISPRASTGRRHESRRGNGLGVRRACERRYFTRDATTLLVVPSCLAEPSIVSPVTRPANSMLPAVSVIRSPRSFPVTGVEAPPWASVPETI